MSQTIEQPELSQPPANSAELAERIHAIDPAAFFVAGRVLRRVIVHDCLLASLSIQAPHHPCYVIEHDALLDLVARDELRPGPRPVPELVMLLQEFEEEEFAARGHAQIFRDAQRLLFHARLHAAYQTRIDERKFLPHVVRRRIDEIGQAEFDEVRLVQRQEDLVLPPRDDRANFIEFMAGYLEQYYFDPDALDVCFPSLAESGERIITIANQDIDLDACLQGLDVDVTSSSASDGQSLASETSSEQSVESPTEVAATPRSIRRLIRRAERAATVGNNVRAAISYWRLSQIADEESRQVPDDAREQAIANIDALRDRLQVAIGFNEQDAERWDLALRELLFATDQHIWPNEARLLYDLQKVCVDTEREIFTVDLNGWIAAVWNRILIFLGRGAAKVWRWIKPGVMYLWAGILFLWNWVRRKQPSANDEQPPTQPGEASSAKDARSLNGQPLHKWRYPALPKIRRALPAQREVLMCKHLRTAEKRLAPARIDEATRLDLTKLLREATHTAEHAMRDKLRGRLEGAFDRLGIRGRNLPERVARKKLIEELLDQIARRGYLTIGDLRDAIARNRAKIPDLAGIGEFFRGDPLLQLNRRLSRSLDGVYRPAEIYLRWLQRLSSLAFANRVGRLFTKFVALPFGGAYVILAGVRYLVYEVTHNDPNLTTPALVVLVGLVLLTIINSRRIRESIGRAQRLARRSFGLLVALLVDLLGLPVVRKILRSQGFRWFARWLAKPLFATVVVCLVLAILGVTKGILGWVAAGTFILANIALNSRSGRDLEEATSEYVVRGWRNFRIVVLSGIFHWIVDWSKRALNAIDRVLYTADEWLRFRRGENRLTFIAKAIVGSIWALVRYVIRFAVIVLIEPQINPIKHFPVVTVGHKLLFVAAQPAATVLSNAFGYDPTEAWALIVSVIWLIPGIFGFMAWELKENWRLYRANQPDTLKPIIVGHHGENMVRMIKPGFHSGTIPKAFKKLRRARKKAIQKNNPAILRKAQEPLAEARHVIHDTFQREVIQLLDDCGAWPHEVTLGEISLATNRIDIELHCDHGNKQPAVITLADQSGRLLAGIFQPGWINQVEHSQRLIIRNALMGFYKLCGVGMIREQIEACFPEHNFHYDIDDRGLALWPQQDFETEVVYEFDHGLILHPTLVSGITPAALPTLSSMELFLNESRLRWDDWVAYWDDCTRGECPLRRLLSEFRVLPASPVAASSSQHPAIAPL